MLKTLWDTFRLLCSMKKNKITGKVVVVPEMDLRRDAEYIKLLLKRNEIMENCIHDMTLGKSPCKYCEDYSDCATHTNGCENWWLRYLNDDELKEVYGDGEPTERLE